MEPPRWNGIGGAGTMVRGALWLLQEVGEGNIFTKQQVREAFPGVSQADRRIRDLRDFGWIIYSNSDDASLSPDEQRFVRAGVAVWDPAARRQAQTKAITAKERQATLAADGYQCVVCGVGGGEAYPDSPNETAVIGVCRRQVLLADGRAEEQLVTECKRCRNGRTNWSVDIERLLAELQALDDDDLRRMQRWVKRGRRAPTPLDRVWYQYRQLPVESRKRIEGAVTGINVGNC